MDTLHYGCKDLLTFWKCSLLSLMIEMKHSRSWHMRRCLALLLDYTTKTISPHFDHERQGEKVLNPY